MAMTDEELKKVGGMIDEEGDVTTPPAQPATQVEEPAVEEAVEPGEDNAALDVPTIEAEGEEAQPEPDAEPAQEAVEEQPRKPGRAQKRIAQLTGKLKGEQERAAFLQAELERMKGLLPNGQPATQPYVAPAPSAPVQDPHEAAWRNLSEEKLQAIITSDDAEVTPAHRSKAMLLLSEKAQERIVQRHIQPQILQQRQASYTGQAMRDYPELFVDGSVENQLLRQTYATDPRLNMIEDGMLIAAERTMARLSRVRMPALAAQNATAQKQLRRAKANAALGTGSGTPSGTPMQRARASDVAQAMLKRGHSDWKKQDGLVDKISDLL